MSRFKTPWHREAHRLGGSDELEIGLHPASLMGATLGAARLTNGFGFYQGVLYLPDRDGPPLSAGETITVSYSHFEPTLHFPWMAARAHVITGLVTDNYAYVHPWESDPWGGGVGGYALTDPFPAFGGWKGIVTFVAVTNDDGETVTWTYPGSGAQAEQYSFDDSDTGGGHIGYSIHDFGSSRVAGNVTAAFSGASTERVGAILWLQSSGAVTVGAMVGEEIVTGGGIVTSEATITLTEDVPVGSQLLITSASKGPTGFSPTDAGARPIVIVRAPSGNRVPKWRNSTQYHMLPEQPLVGAAIPASSAPSGAAGGALDGTYPNPGIAASVAGAGLAESSDVLSVNVDNSTIEINSDTLRVKDEGITEAKLNHAIVAKGNSGSSLTLTVTDGSWQTLTLNANCTITVAGFTSSKWREVVVKVTQDATGGRSITWDSDVSFYGNSQPTTTANAVTYFLLWADAGDSAIYASKIGAGSITESDITLSDVTTDNVTSSAHGFAPKSPADATKFLNGATTPAYAQVKDSDLSLSDITTNNASTSNHGFLLKLDNNSAHFMRGDGTWATPSGGSTWSVLTDGVVAGPALVFAAGDVIMVQT